MPKRHRENEEEEEQQQQRDEQNLSLELTILSAESLKPSSLLPFSLKPYVTVSTPFSPSTLFSTRTDQTGTSNPTFNQTFTLPLKPSFLNPKTEHETSIHVSILSKRPLLLSPTELGWCRICTSDIMDGYQPLSKQRRLSYSLRNPSNGCKGHGYVHVAARLVGTAVDRLTVGKPVQQLGWARVVIGVPVPVQGPVLSVPVGLNGELWTHYGKRGCCRADSLRLPIKRNKTFNCD